MYIYEGVCHVLINPMQKTIKQSQSYQAGCVQGACSFTKGEQRKPCDKETFQQRPEGSEGTSDVIIGGNESRVEEKDKRNIRQESDWLYEEEQGQ